MVTDQETINNLQWNIRYLETQVFLSEDITEIYRKRYYQHREIIEELRDENATVRGRIAVLEEQEQRNTTIIDNLRRRVSNLNKACARLRLTLKGSNK